MARKSKRHLGECAGGGFASLDVKRDEAFATAIYARLSIENSGKDDDGASIENQVDACREYVSASEDLELYKIYEDNGWSGTNMNRPAWEEMMDDVRAGKVRAIVVRDLSRFGRNYLETGTYLEKVFPRLDVRFISVKEGFDTFKTDGTAETLMVPLQNLINDLYAKDISRKIHASFKVKREERTFRSGSVPYGYKWDDGHTGYVIDEAHAVVVRRIFTDYLAGKGTTVIADELNGEGIASPRRVKSGTESIWRGRTIKDILLNPAYYGAIACGKTRSELYRNVPRSRVPKEEWLVFEGDHEAIVSKKDFEAASVLLSKASERWGKNRTGCPEKLDAAVGVLKGKVFCGDCGRAIAYFRTVPKKGSAYGRYFCRSDNRHNWGRVRLESTVLGIIHEHIDMAVQFEELLLRYRNSDYVLKAERRLKQDTYATLGRLEDAQKKRRRLYEDYAEGLLDAEEFKEAKDVFEQRVDELDRKYSLALAELKRFEDSISSKNRWIRLFRSIEKSDKLTREVADALIERVELFENDVVRVVFKFHDVFEYTRDFMEKGGFI